MIERKDREKNHYKEYLHQSWCFHFSWIRRNPGRTQEYVAPPPLAGTDDPLRCMTVIPYLMDLHRPYSEGDEEDVKAWGYDDGITEEDLREGKLPLQTTQLWLELAQTKVCIHWCVSILVHWCCLEIWWVRAIVYFAWLSVRPFNVSKGPLPCTSAEYLPLDDSETEV